MHCHRQRADGASSGDVLTSSCCWAAGSAVSAAVADGGEVALSAKMAEDVAIADGVGLGRAPLLRATFGAEAPPC